MNITKSHFHLLDAVTAIRLEPETPEYEKAFMARQLVQVTLPHSNPGDIPLWGRTNGKLTLTIKPDWTFDLKTAQPKCIGIPYGTIPRLLLFWITTEALRTKNKKLELGKSLSDFMRKLDLVPTGGRWGTITRLRDQMNRLFRAKISFEVNEEYHDHFHQSWLDMQVAPKGELWWDIKQSNQSTLFGNWIELGEDFYQAILSAPVPIDLRALRALKRSPLALDLYAWVTYRVFTLQQKGKDQFIPWRGLVRQLGSDYTDLDNFRKKVKVTLRKIQAVYPALRMEEKDGGFILKPSRSAISSKL